jgi:hypothetical protein
MSVEVDPNVESHFRVTVDLRRLSGFLEAYNVYCRFSYALFDSQRQSISGPPVPVRPGSKRNARHGGVSKPSGSRNGNVVVRFTFHI